MNCNGNQDQYHLQLLSTFYYVVAGLAVLFGCFPFIHLGVGLALLAGGIPGQEPPAALFGLFFVVIAAAMILFFWTLAVFLVITGRALVKREKYTFCLVVAAVACMFWPFGTALGVATIIVLMRPSVKESFEGGGQ